MQRKSVMAFAILAIVLMLGAMSVSAVTRTITVRVEGMHCGGCASSIEKKLKATVGVEDARVSFEKKEAWIQFDDQKVTESQLREAITSTGYKVVESSTKK